tara:strand:+ start:326 stop:490 length:165 start_codon:yes stop_codon:yes gene_type:complete
MISDDLLPIAIFVFLIMLVGLALTILEFRYGEPKRQQDLADGGEASRGENKKSQ